MSQNPQERAYLDDLLELARDRAARGNGTRRDWERVAAVDPDVAASELREFLRRANVGAHGRANPYAQNQRDWATGAGFVIGCIVMAITWVIFPWLREQAGDNQALKDLATFTQFLSTLFVPIGAWLGSRWSAKSTQATTPSIADQAVLTRTTPFPELLDMFETTQHPGRAHTS